MTVYYNDFADEERSVDWYDSATDYDDSDADEFDYNDSMDGDFDSSMASARYGTDEDYFCFGTDE